MEFETLAQVRSMQATRETLEMQATPGMQAMPETRAMPVEKRSLLSRLARFFEIVTGSLGTGKSSKTLHGNMLLGTRRMQACGRIALGRSFLFNNYCSLWNLRRAQKLLKQRKNKKI
ncbi:hypothetical protein [uncultured Shimia sp.]|uniref:hypothetical protein n=1 Tax=uncultured Shimia sp. TaxID=573152 RepID=UPI00261CF478|nr:hypothetical protein [uncultured Shimia sp.]